MSGATRPTRGDAQAREVQELDREREVETPSSPMTPTDLMRHVGLFSTVLLPSHRLRRYQREAAQAVFDSVRTRRGDQFAIVFSRQAGKDEMLAQLLAMLLIRQVRAGGSAVVAAPTFRPQASLSRDRLLSRLRAIPGVTEAMPVRTQDGYIVRLGEASARFLSTARGANARGQTADMLLVANEAQDIDPATWDAVFDPMAASSNATTVFMGTVWSKSSLLARQIRYLRQLESLDGRKRVWMVPWTQVAEELPAYGERVQQRIQQLGERHPFIRTEYELQELDADGGLFPEHRLAQMAGGHPRQFRGQRGKRYAMLVDVAGEEEQGTGPESWSGGVGTSRRRDSTALTVVEVDTAHADGRARYRVVDRRLWTGVGHTTLHETLVDLAQNVWQARWLVVDATGIGAGLASFLRASLRSEGGTRVIPFIFTAQSKSRLGWDFLGLIDSGRFKEYTRNGEAEADSAVTRLYDAQVRATTFEVAPGPGNLLRWSVPARSGHDDLVVSAALVAVLDGEELHPRVARGTSEQARP